jgi:guanylate kinase
MNDKKFLERAILLISGSPASGKDTITKEIIKNDNRFSHFKKHKINNGGKLDSSYILVSQQEFKDIEISGGFLQYHYRYDRGYGVSYDELNKLWNNNKIPIIHVGKYENIHSFFNIKKTQIISILLLTCEQETKNRIQKRHKNDADEISRRMLAYHEERHELSELIELGIELKFDLIIENSYKSPENVSNLILSIL